MLAAVGVNGADGNRGGDITLAIGSASPNFRFISKGGDGVPGQQGGDGGAGADAPPNKHVTLDKRDNEACNANDYTGGKKTVRSTIDCPENDGGSCTIVTRPKDKSGSNYYGVWVSLQWWKGQPGAAGSNGGKAGRHSNLQFCTRVML